jgi:hypothetical protein
MLKFLRTTSVLLAMSAALGAPAYPQVSAKPQESPWAMRAPAAVPQGAPTLSAEQRAAEEAAEKGTPEQQAFAHKVADAMASKDYAAMRQLVAPSTLKCIGKNEDFLQDRFKRQFALPIDRKFNLKITKLPPHILNPSKYATYPMPPTYLMGMDFDIGDNHDTVNLPIGQEDSKPSQMMSARMRLVVLLTISLAALAMLALGVGYRSIWWLGCGLLVGAVGLLLLFYNPIGHESANWYEAQPCPTEAGMVRFAKLQQTHAIAHERAKAAAAKVEDPVKSQLLALIGQHDAVSAWKLCMSSLHYDFQTCRGMVAILAGDQDY